MAWLDLFKAKPFFNDAQQKQIVEAIQVAEKNTSGEIRVFVESKNYLMNPIERAAEVFTSLKMDQTKNKNAVLLYIAFKHRELSIYADHNIYIQLGKSYWKSKVAYLVQHYKQGHYVQALIDVILEIGVALQAEFPYTQNDKNELPDEIVFGK